jgi:Holliday junction resolvase RusA-like endonuclease
MATITANAVRFTVYGTPAQMGSKKAFYSEKLKRSFVTDDNSAKRKNWANAVSSAAAEAMDGGELIAGPVRLVVRFYFARPQSHYGTGRNAGTLKASSPAHHAQSPDLDKLIRCLSDALTGTVFRDDKQVWRIESERHWTETQERAEVEVLQ